MNGKRFCERREEVEVINTVTATMEGNVTNISEIVLKDRHLSIWMITDMVNNNKEIVRQILHDKLKVTKVYEGSPKNGI